MIKLRNFTPDFKAQASRSYGIENSVLSHWKQEFFERSATLFEQIPVIGESQVAIGRLGGEWVL
jgi:transposase-like protein